MNAIEYAQRANELFTVPNTANELRILFERNDSTMQDIAKVVLKDPGMTVHLLKYANSPIFRFERKIESLEKAIQVIGVKAVYEFAIAFGITNMITKEHARYIDVDKFWQQSILCALYGVYLARVCKEKDKSRLYTSGLLHNVGELAVLRVSPTIARQCREFNKESTPMQIQQDILGFSYAEISASLLQQWLIPDSLVSTVAMQHHDDIPAVTIESQIMQLAYAMAIVNTYPDYYSIELNIPEFLYSSLDLAPSIISDAKESCEEEFEALCGIFRMHSTQAA